MATEDLTGFTEVDAGGDITVTTARCTIDTMIRAVDSYVWKDYEVGHFDDFEHLLTVVVSAFGAAAMGGFYYVGSTYGSVPTIDYLEGFGVDIYGSGEKFELYNFKTMTHDDYIAGDGTYYLTIERSGTTATCKIYSDSGRNTLLDTLTMTVDTDAHRYLQCCFSRNSAGADEATLYMEDLDLQEGAQNYDRLAAVALGVTTASSRVMAYDRDSSVVLGITIVASRIKGVVRSASVPIGLTIAASVAMAYTRSASVALGLTSTASRAMTYTRNAATTLGITTAASRIKGVVRSASVPVGLTTAASRAIAVTRSAAVAVGITTTASRIAGAVRNASVAIGITTTASKAWGIFRSASVAIGIITTAPREPIDIGVAATDRTGALGGTYTRILLDNPANVDGVITKVEIWAQSNISDCKVGTFYGTAPNFTCRGYETIGSVPAGSKQTFSSLDIEVRAGDYLGIYYSTGYLEDDSSGGAGTYYKSGDQFDAGQQEYTITGAYLMSLYGIGGSGIRISYNRAGVVALGIATTASRALTYTRNAVVALGTTTAASAVKGFTRSASIAIGITTAASVVKGFTRSAAVAIGITTAASVVKGFVRVASVAIGITTVASVTKGFIRNAAVAIGITTVASRGIDIGAVAINRDHTFQGSYTVIALDNPANARGKIKSVEIWAFSDMTSVTVGTFYGSGTDYTSRDFESIGDVAYGAKRTISGLDIDVEAGDFIGLYWAAAGEDLDRDITGGAGLYYKPGNQFGQGLQTYADAGAVHAISLYGTGQTVVAKNYERLAAVAIGIVTASGRTVAYGRDSAVVLGLTTVASRIKGATRSAAMAIGITTAASRIRGVVRNAATVIGLTTVASRVVAYSRSASVQLGLSISAGLISIWDGTIGVLSEMPTHIGKLVEKATHIPKFIEKATHIGKTRHKGGS